MAIRFPSALDSVVANAPAPAVANNKQVANIDQCLVANGNRHGKYADLDKRRAYMREYMRARRAK